MDCNNCEKARIAEEQIPEKKTSWSFVELQADTMKLIIKWMGAIILVLICAIIGLSLYYNYKWSEYDTVDISQDGQGNNVVGDYNRSYYEPAGEDTQTKE